MLKAMLMFVDRTNNCPEIISNAENFVSLLVPNDNKHETIY